MWIAGWLPGISVAGKGNSMKKLLRGILDRTIDGLAVFTRVLVILVMLVVSADVFLRYFFNRPMFWVLESTQFALVFITFLGAAWVLKNDGHVRMDILINRFSQRAQDRINIVTSLLSAIVCLVVTWYGVKVWWDYIQIDYLYPGSLKIPAYLLVMVIPLGGFLLFTQFLRKAYGYLANLKAP